MGTILCATRGGEDSLRTQDAVIARAKEQGADILFLYAADVEFLGKTASGVRTDVMQQEMDRMGTFLLVMACERAAAQGGGSPAGAQARLAQGGAQRKWPAKRKSS